MNIENITKTSRFCHKEDFLIPNGPLPGNLTLPHPHSCLSHGTYLTNKHYHFKLPRVIVGNGLCIKKESGFGHKIPRPRAQTKTCGANLSQIFDREYLSK